MVCYFLPKYWGYFFLNDNWKKTNHIFHSFFRDEEKIFINLVQYIHMYIIHWWSMCDLTGSLKVCLVVSVFAVQRFKGGMVLLITQPQTW